MSFGSRSAASRWLGWSTTLGALPTRRASYAARERAVGSGYAAIAMNAPRQARRLEGPLLAGLVVAVCLWLVTLGAWWVATNATPDIRELSSDERQDLVGELLQQSPGVFQWAWFKPEIGYTLRPNADLQAWGSSFRSNELGYRSHAPDKAPDVFRVVFIGDSWTYGMGVEHAESYPEVFARLANERQIAERYGKSRVEAWTLALPGYNTLNAVAAFWYHFERLRPDAVVVGVSANDNHSTHAVLPNGSFTQGAAQPDFFGDRHAVMYGPRRIDSFRYAERWRRSFAALRDLELRLAELEIPLTFFFVGRPRELDMQWRAAEAGLESQFSVVPLEMTKGSYNNRRWGHGTPEANAIYGGYVYQDLAAVEGWPLLVEEPQSHRFQIAAALDADDLRERYEQAAEETSAELFPSSFEPSRRAQSQALGHLRAGSGLLGPAATLLLRRPTAFSAEGRRGPTRPGACRRRSACRRPRSRASRGSPAAARCRRATAPRSRRAPCSGSPRAAPRRRPAPRSRQAPPRRARAGRSAGGRTAARAPRSHPRQGPCRSGPPRRRRAPRGARWRGTSCVPARTPPRARGPTRPSPACPRRSRRPCRRPLRRGPPASRPRPRVPRRPRRPRRPARTTARRSRAGLRCCRRRRTGTTRGARTRRPAAGRSCRSAPRPAARAARRRAVRSATAARRSAGCRGPARGRRRGASCSARAAAPWAPRSPPPTRAGPTGRRGRGRCSAGARPPALPGRPGRAGRRRARARRARRAPSTAAHPPGPVLAAPGPARRSQARKRASAPSASTGSSP